MLDRTVELSEVIEALRSGRSELSVASVAATPPTPQSPPRQSPLGKKLEPTLDNVRSVWSQVVQDTRAKTPLLGTVLAEAEVVAVDGRTIAIRPGNAVHAEGLERQRETIAQAIGAYISEAPRVRVVAAGGGSGGSNKGGGGVTSGGGGGGTAERITPETATAERLKSLRSKDPTLSAAVDALDLELLE
jgi:hypothetical protein